MNGIDGVPDDFLPLANLQDPRKKKAAKKSSQAAARIFALMTGLRRLWSRCDQAGRRGSKGKCLLKTLGAHRRRLFRSISVVSQNLSNW